VAVPEFGAGGIAVEIEGLVISLAYLFNRITNQDAGSAVFLESHWALCVPAQGQAGSAKDTAFFLQAAAVCEHDAKGRRSAKQIHDLGFLLSK
jgi:hypothetical protein